MMWHEDEKCQGPNHGRLFMPHEGVWGFYTGNGKYHALLRREVTC